LLLHAETLETLQLDMREVRFHWSPPFQICRLGSLRPFSALKSLILCETTLRSSFLPLIVFPDQVLHCRISELIPIRLESFSLFLESFPDSETECQLEEFPALLHLLYDCEVQLLQLKEVIMMCKTGLSAPATKAAFNKIGVQLKLVKETQPLLAS
jgi:hypothetical protein